MLNLINFIGGPRPLEQEDIDFFLERERKQLDRWIEAEQEVQTELEKLRISFFCLMILHQKIYFDIQHRTTLKPDTVIPSPTAVIAKPKPPSKPPNVPLKVTVIAKPKNAAATSTSSSVSKASSPSSASSSAPPLLKRKHDSGDEPSSKKQNTTQPVNKSSENTKTSNASNSEPKKPSLLGGLVDYGDDDE